MELIGQKSLENREEWVEFRKSLPKWTVFGSVFASWFGHGYDSLKTVLDIVNGRKPVKEIDRFTQKAMDHGNRCEQRAFEWFKQSRLEIEYPDVTTRPCFNNQYYRETDSLVVRSFTDENVLAMITPDAFILETRWDAGEKREYQAAQIVEIKCPVRMASKFDSLEEWMTDFTEKHPLGYTKAFLQALLYASVDPIASEFYTAHYFEHGMTNMEGMRVYKFDLTDDLRKYALDNLHEFSELLRTDNQTKCRVPSARKKLAEQWQNDSNTMDWISTPRFITFSDEQDGEESGQE